MVALLVVSGCAHQTMTGQRIQRTGDEIVVCGQLIHTGAPVVTWMDPGGYDAYRVERRFCAWDDADWDTSHKQVKGLATPNRFGLRFGSPRENQAVCGGPPLTPEEIQRYRGGGWTLPELQQKVDQFVLHYDVAGISRNCFRTLHDQRDLSVHFMLDLDGTIYQTLDLKERAWHATTSNDRSIGIEIANFGAYGKGGEGGQGKLAQWYRKQPDGHTRIVLGPAFGNGKLLRTPGFIGHPIRDEPVTGVIQGHDLVQYDLTPQQYDSLIKLTATLCETFPRIKCEAPREPDGSVTNHKLPDDRLAAYHGVLGHYHVQTDKTDPGPAFQWDMLLSGARKIMAQAKHSHWQEEPMVPMAAAGK
jgi:N-acetyl-anhydromuramyl-L-alanine amidase AmpD